MPTQTQTVKEARHSDIVDDDVAIRAALAVHLGANVSDLTIVVNENTGTHARGGVENGYFMAAKVDGQWQIVAAGQGVLDCQALAQYGFSPSMLPECPSATSDEDAIRAALAAYLGANVNDLTIVIAENTGAHARGGVENGYFMAAKVDGQWRIVAAGQGALDCQALAQYGFPSTMLPECQNANGIDQIRFKPGGTYTFVQKSIKAGQGHAYMLRASAGQTVIVSAVSPNSDVWIGIKGVQDGQQLLSDSSRTGSWTGTLPRTQGYEITLKTDSPGTYYFLEIEIPANVRFEPGTYSTTIDGHIEVFDVPSSVSVDNHVTYLVYASAGQTMDVQISSPNLDVLSLGVYGQTDGQPYLRYQVKNSGFNGVLPLTQGYYLKVFSNGPSTDFTLTITII
jgi:hypothetical protein